MALESEMPTLLCKLLYKNQSIPYPDQAFPQLVYVLTSMPNLWQSTSPQPTLSNVAVSNNHHACYLGHYHPPSPFLLSPSRETQHRQARKSTQKHAKARQTRTKASHLLIYFFPLRDASYHRQRTAIPSKIDSLHSRTHTMSVSVSQRRFTYAGDDDGLRVKT